MICETFFSGFDTKHRSENRCCDLTFWRKSRNNIRATIEKVGVRARLEGLCIGETSLAVKRVA